MFARQGYSPPAPEMLDDRQLHGRLWELIYAAAGRNFFFRATDHLSDRQLYTLLHNEWLPDPTADLPPASGWNCTIAMSEFNARGDTYQVTFLRFYADEDERRRWQVKHPTRPLPPHVDPPHDRDRFLPIAPEESSDDAARAASGESENEPDPLGLAEVDRAIAAAKGESSLNQPPATAPPESAFDAELRASEPESWTPPADQLAEKNIPLLPPAEITDEMLTPILWELLHNLALQGFYVLHTNHLSDRQLYIELWERGLRDPANLPGRNPTSGWFHDFLGGASAEEIATWLRYYASDEERAKHAQENPQDSIPRKEKPPFNRDWRLPKGPF